MSDTAMPAPVILTQQAIDKVGAMIAEEGDLDLKLRVYISGGGCSGFKYNFAFDDKAAEDAMIAEIEAAKKDGDTLGGVVEVVADGLPIGLGSFISGPDRLDSQLAGAVMGIQAIKGVEIGDGFETARRRGSVAHDEIYPGPDGILRSTNRAGGLEGGMTNGQALRVRAAMKPISTVPRALATVDMATGAEAVAIHQRSDVCAVPAAGVVVEAMVALVLARAALEKFGGDSLNETRFNVDGYLQSVHARGAAQSEAPPEPSLAAD